MLSEFIAWFKRTKKDTNLVDMALAAGPKRAGKKPSSRKRTNAKRKPVEEVVDLLQSQGCNSQANKVRTVDQAHTGGDHASVVGTPSVNARTKTRATETVPPPSTSEHELRIFVSGQSNNMRPTMAYPPSTTSAATSALSSHQISMARQVTGAANYGCLQQLQRGQAQSSQCSQFSLRWVAGTRISKCYGCRGDIANPPVTAPDDLVVVYRDIREYRDKNTGAIVYTGEPQNIHFHLRIRCIQAKYIFFDPACLHIPVEFIPFLQQPHVTRLASEFGWILRA